MKIFLESQKYTSKLSGNVFWDRWDHLVAQKSKKCVFLGSNDVSSRNPLLTSVAHERSHMSGIRSLILPGFQN